jgi:hypothetical protein
MCDSEADGDADRLHQTGLRACAEPTAVRVRIATQLRARRYTASKPSNTISLKEDV